MTEPLISTMGNDPDIGELVDVYVAALGTRIADIERALAAGDRRRTEFLAHQMVGSAGMHGLRPIGDAAQRLEAVASDGAHEVVAVHLRELAALCARARAR